MKPIAALLLAVAPLAGVAAQDPAAAGAVTKADRPAKPKRICRSQRETGSNMAVSTCHSQAEWNALEQGDKASADAYRQQLNAQPH